MPRVLSTILLYHSITIMSMKNKNNFFKKVLTWLGYKCIIKLINDLMEKGDNEQCLQKRI